MGFFDIPELNIAQKSGGKGWNPANGVPFSGRLFRGHHGQIRPHKRAAVLITRPSPAPPSSYGSS